MNTDLLCKLVTCLVTDDIPSYVGSYSLQSGTFFTNLAISVPIGGGGFYIVPPGTINIIVPPNPQFISYQGCSAGISEPVPSGSTPAEIAAMVSDVMNQAAVQLAGCNTPTPANPGLQPGATVFWNTPQTETCTNAPQLKLIGTLPGLVTFGINGISIGAGIFSSSISQSDANLQATTYLAGIINGGLVVQCGWWNTQQTFTCTDHSVQTVPADTYFSQISQADADAQALAAAEAACPVTIDWSKLLWGTAIYDDSGTQSPLPGVMGETFALTSARTGAFNPNAVLEATITVNATTPVNCQLSALFNVVGGSNPVTHGQFNINSDSTGFILAGTIFRGGPPTVFPFTVNPHVGQVLTIHLELSAGDGNNCNSAGTFSNV